MRPNFSEAQPICEERRLRGPRIYTIEAKRVAQIRLAVLAADNNT